MSAISSDQSTAAGSRTLVDRLASPLGVTVVLLLYLAAHVAMRLWETPNIGKNDVQEAVSAQFWAWGYHPRNPPLHTWLLMSSYTLFGVTTFAHVILKTVLLGATYVFAYLSGRRLLKSAGLAALSALSLTLLAPFAWTVHTALTHTLLLAVMVFATIWAGVRLTDSRRLGDYVLFGACIGLGFLAKYSFALFLVPFLLAMLSQAELRRAILDWRFLISLIVAVALFAPHGAWMLIDRFDFIQFLSEKQRSVEPQPYWADLASGLGNVVVAVLSFMIPFLLFVPFAFFGARKATAEPASPWARALTLLSVLGLAALALDVIVLRATQFEQRYMMCALIATPLVFCLWLDRRPHTTKGRAWLAYGALATIIVVFGGLAGRALLNHQNCTRCWDEMPIAEFSDEIRSAGFRDGTIIADHYNVAGNMRLLFPHSRITAANYFVRQPPFEGEGKCLLVWDARNAGDPTPPAITTYLESIHLPLPPGGPVYLEAPLYRSTTRNDRFAYWILPNADGNCRPR